MAFMRLPVVWWCFGFFLLSTVTLAVVQNFSLPILQALHQVSFEAATLTLTVYMLCSALGVLVGGFVASHWPFRSDRIVASSMCGGAILLAVCASGWLGALGTMAVLAATGFAVGIGGPSRDLMNKKSHPPAPQVACMPWFIRALTLGLPSRPLSLVPSWTVAGTAPPWLALQRC